MDSTAPLTRLIGVRVRQERQTRQWTLDQLVEESGVSRRMLIDIEQGVANPSIGILLKLSDALEVGLPALVDSPAAAAVNVTRSGAGAELWSGEAGGRAVLVASTAPPEVVRATGQEPFDTTAGGASIVEHPVPGEVVWRDEAGVTCRRWNWRQATRTQLSDDTTAALFILDALDPLTDDALDGAAADLTGHLTRLGPDVRFARRLLGRP